MSISAVDFDSFFHHLMLTGFSGFELYWPYGNIVARLYEGGEVAAINGFMHKIDNVLILPQDLRAGDARAVPDFLLIFFLALIGPRIIGRR